MGLARDRDAWTHAIAILSPRLRKRWLLWLETVSSWQTGVSDAETTAVQQPIPHRAGKLIQIVVQVNREREEQELIGQRLEWAR